MNNLKIGDPVSFNSEYNNKVPFPFEGTGLVTKIHPLKSHNGYVGERRYDVLFPIGTLFEIPRHWVIKMPVKHHVCPLEDEDMMWGDK